jgi:hypothetical protein
MCDAVTCENAESSSSENEAQLNLGWFRVSRKRPLMALLNPEKIIFTFLNFRLNLHFLHRQ